MLQDEAIKLCKITIKTKILLRKICQNKKVNKQSSGKKKYYYVNVHQNEKITRQSSVKNKRLLGKDAVKLKDY